MPDGDFLSQLGAAQAQDSNVQAPAPDQTSDIGDSAPPLTVHALNYQGSAPSGQTSGPGYAPNAVPALPGGYPVPPASATPQPPNGGDFLSQLAGAQAQDNPVPAQTPAANGADFLSQLTAAQSTAAPPSASASQSNPNGILANSPSGDTWGSGFIKGLGTAAVEGASGAAGIVGSLRDLTDELAQRTTSWVTGLPLDQIQARDAQVRAAIAQHQIVSDPLSLFPNASDVSNKITSYTGSYQPQTEAGRLAQSGAASVIGGALLSPEAALTAALPNAAAGVATQGASDLGADPLVSTAAGLFAGAGAGKIGVGDTLATRFSRGAQEAKAGNVLLNSAQDPAALQAALNNPPAPNIPNEAPTTYQATGDEGIGQLEREVRAAAPAAFTQRAAQQAEAQMAAKAMIQSGGAPEDVANYFTAQARAFNQQWLDAHDEATQEAQNAATTLGGDQPATSYGQAIANELTPQYQAIQNAARHQVASLGGTQAPEALGSAMRLQARSAADAADQQLGALYDAVPQDMATSIAPLKQTVQNLYSRMEPAVQATMTPAEGAIRDTIGQYPSSVPFSSARAIDTLITSSMRNELRSAGYGTPAYARMVQLKQAWENAMSDSVASRAAQDDAAVAAGTMAPEDAMAAKMQAQVDAFRANKDSLANSRTNTAFSSPRGGSSYTGPSGAAKSAAGRFPSGQGPQGISGQALPGPITQAGLDALAAAKTGAKEVYATFRSGPVGAILRKAGTSNSYKMSDYAVPQAVFPKGPGGFAAVQAYRNAVGNDADAISALHNYAAATLRKAALRDDGTLDPAGYTKWRAGYADALRAVPELKSSFDNAAHATDALQRFGRFRPDMAPTAVPELFFAPGPAGAAGVNQLRSLIGSERADPILGDYATASMRAKAERNGVIDPKALQVWTEKYQPALSQFPELAAKFQDAGKATETVAQIAAMRKQAVADYEKGAVGKLIGVSDPTTVQRHIGSLFNNKNGVPLMRDLVARAKQDPSGLALQGIRQAVADEITRRFVSSTKIGASDQAGFKPGSFSKFMADNKPILAQAFSPEDMENWGGLVRAVEQANRSIVGSKIPGGSNTPQDILKALKQSAERGQNETVFGRLWKAALVSKEFLEPALANIGLGHLAMPLGMVGAVGSNVMAGLRNAGMQKVADLVKEGLLNPDLAKTYVMKASARANAGSELSLAHQLKRLSILGPIAQQSQTSPPGPQTQAYARGGFVNGASWTGGGPFFKGPFLASGGRISGAAPDRRSGIVMDPAVPETPATLAAQQRELVEGKRSLVLFKGGAHKLPLPDGMREISLGADVAQYNPHKVLAQDIRDAAADDRLGFLLKLGSISKKEAIARAHRGETPVAVVERAPDGTELRAALGTHATAERQLRYFNATKGNPANLVRLESPDAVIAGRLAGAQGMQARAAGGRITVDSNPSNAQKAVGNYQKGHMRLHGLDITIENPRGSYRIGVGKDGKPWKAKLPNHYGYIRGTTGADGDHVDCYVGPNPESEKVFVIDQKDLSTGKFDEHKCMLGFNNSVAARRAYELGFSDDKGAQRIMKLTPMSLDQFKGWLRSGKTKDPIGRAA
jgi:hypothetical protein